MSIFSSLVPKVSADSVLGEIKVPISTQTLDISNPEKTVADIVTLVLNWAFVIGVLLVLGNLIFGAYTWITSGGDKSKVADARNRMIWAAVGLILLAAAWVITMVIVGLVAPDTSGLPIQFNNGAAPAMSVPEAAGGGQFLPY